jgi:hypothetical protein
VVVTLNGSTGPLYLDGTQVGKNTAMTLTPTSLGATTLNYSGRSQYAAAAFRMSRGRRLFVSRAMRWREE